MALRQIGDKPLSEPILTNSLTHLCGTRGRWVNQMAQHRSAYIVYYCHILKVLQDMTDLFPLGTFRYLFILSYYSLWSRTSCGASIVTVMVEITVIYQEVQRKNVQTLTTFLWFMGVNFNNLYLINNKKWKNYRKNIVFVQIMYNVCMLE